MFTDGFGAMIATGTLETLYMVLASMFFAYVIGLPVGVFLVVADRDGIRPIPALQKIIGVIVNLLRSVPFIILLLALLPFTRLVVGTTLGATATIVPLVIGAAPFIARLVESSLREVDHGIIEAAQAMGATPMQIVFRVMIPEALPSLIMGAAIAITTILGYSAMSGFTGGGGLGDIAVRYGYYRYQTDVMLFTVVLLVIIVQIFQEVGTRISKKNDKRIND